MGLTQTHALGRTVKAFAKIEAVAKTQEPLATADAFKALSLNISPSVERKDRDDWKQTRSLLERITNKSAVVFDTEMYLMPSGTAGTPPDNHPFLYAAMGGYANDPGVKDTYSLGDSQTQYTITTKRESESVLMDELWGGVVEGFGIAISGGDQPKIKFDGWGMGHASTGPAVLNGAMVASTTMVLTAATADNVEVGSILQIGTDDGAGAGVKVTVASASPSFTVSPAATAIDASAVIPFVPAETTAGAPIPVTAGSLVIDAVPILITAAEINVKNTHKAVDDHAFENYPSDAIPGNREVKGKLTIRARTDYIIELGKRKKFTARNIVLVCGSVAGSIVTITMPTVEIEFEPVNIPTTEEAMISLPFTAMGSSGGDELTIVYS